LYKQVLDFIRRTLLPVAGRKKRAVAVGLVLLAASAAFMASDRIAEGLGIPCDLCKSAGVAQSAFERARLDQEADQASPEASYTQFLEQVKAGEIAAAILPRQAEGSQTVAFQTRDGHYATTVLPSASLSASVANLLVEHHVEILTNVPAKLDADDVGALVHSLLPTVIIGIILLMMTGRVPGVGGSTGEWIVARKNETRFNDVQGVDEAKAELVEAVGQLLDPAAAGDLGANAPRGVLLVGPPGTGKTMLARAVAGEAGASFLRLSGSDFVEMWAGLGARRVRRVFAAARKRSPCVIFIDEIDSLGRKRSAGSSGAERESDQTLNALLVELDGFSRDDRILVLAATNRVDTLDEALVRPGRFDRHVHVGLPDLAGRRAILDAHAKRVKLDQGADLEATARGTPGFSGAELANIINEAAFAANRRGAKTICSIDLEAARDRVMMGSERKSMVWREEDRILTAWHEAGHALIGLLMPASDPVHKATIVPRGRALGMVVRLPDHDRFTASRAKLEADLAVAVGGRIAEELKFGPEKISTGAEADIKAATDLAYQMVAKWGMSRRLGFMNWSGGEDRIEEPVRLEMKREIDRALARVRRMMTRHRAALDTIAQALLDRETLDRTELERLVEAAVVIEAEAPARLAPRKRIRDIHHTLPMAAE
jgi:cell division protease FtsH